MAQLVFIFFLLTSVFANAEAIKSSAGVELGGNGSLMLSDPSLGAFGAGAGLQGSVFYSMWDERPIGAKLRFEILQMQQTALQKTASDYILTGSYLKSFTQSMSVISVGAEGRFKSQFQSFFWEALLGYAMGNPANVTVSYGVNDVNVVDTLQTTSSGFVISGGIGLSRQFSEKIIGVMSLRTLFLIGSIYNSTTLNNKAFIPLPLMFSLGVKIPFDIGK